MNVSFSIEWLFILYDTALIYLHFNYSFIMKWKNSQKGKTRLKFVQDKADGKEGAVVHTWSALICSLENVKNYIQWGSLGWGEWGQFLLPSEVLESTWLPALHFITGEACSPNNHFPGFGTGCPQDVLPHTLSTKLPFSNTHRMDCYFALVLQTPPHCLWLSSLPCLLALGSTTWLLRQRLSTCIITIIFLGLVSLDKLFVHSFI